MKREIKELEENYELELDKIAESIKKNKARRVLLQFPDGMKPYATAVADELKSRIKNVKFFIWLGSCFGACDISHLPKNIKIDLLVQFGHSKFVKTW